MLSDLNLQAIQAKQCHRFVRLFPASSTILDRVDVNLELTFFKVSIYSVSIALCESDQNFLSCILFLNKNKNVAYEKE